MGNVPPANQHRLAHEHEEIPAENAPVQSPTELNLNSLIKIQNTSIVEWGNTNETWQPWPEPVFYKLFLDPEGRNASLTATKIEIWSRNFFSEEISTIFRAKYKSSSLLVIRRLIFVRGHEYRPSWASYS